MYFEESSKHEYQTFIDILTEMVANYMEKQSQKGEALCARDNQAIQSSESSSTGKEGSTLCESINGGAS